jgi:hypothetical protein
MDAIPTDQRDAADAEDALLGRETARPLVYMVVGLGAALTVISVLIASDGLNLATAATLLVAVLPYLVYSRLALLHPGADAVIAGITLLVAGLWGAVSYYDRDLGAFVELAAYLLAMVLVVFGIGHVLRHLCPDAAGDLPDGVAGPAAPTSTRRERRAARRERS